MNSKVIFSIVGIFLILGFSFIFLSYPQNDFENNSTPLYDSSVTVGIARWIDDSEYDKNIAGFKIALSENGFVEGKNIEYVTEIAYGDKMKQQKIIDKFVASDVDLIYSLTTPGTLIAINQNTIPVVFSIVTFPVEAGIVNDSDSRIIVGTSNFISVQHQLDTFTKIMPLTKLGFVHGDEPNSNIQYDLMKEVGISKGIEVVDLKISSLDDSKTFLSDSIDNVDAFYHACDTLVQSGVEEISIIIALDAGKPTFTCNKEGVYFGSLFGAVVDFQSIGEDSGILASSILKGHEILETPRIVYGDEHHMLNIKMAELLGIEIPTSIVEDSDEIIDWII